MESLRFDIDALRLDEDAKEFELRAKAAEIHYPGPQQLKDLTIRISGWSSIKKSKSEMVPGCWGCLVPYRPSATQDVISSIYDSGKLRQCDLGDGDIAIRKNVISIDIYFDGYRIVFAFAGASWEAEADYIGDVDKVYRWPRKRE